MTQDKREDELVQDHDDDATLENNVPKTESSSEYEGAPDREPTGNVPVETKVETSSSSGQ